ncbi:SusC/RagA family TonB-linked outer membrane protein [Niastella sp. OAS944]|uniref:SusC/RagA family TonB-linked outer membrane protein n=1 Tax=Niastella sp. OAS944 TaxID=2664089 RepID=UPI00349406AB|nr:TonB-linked SusC/RagA family outer membrane protein [Chitinophagaceae bacterium OAS944]
MRKFLMSLWCSLLLLSGEVMAQTRTLTGKITDSKGNPVSNVSVIVKGTRVGTVTDTDGGYSLNVPVSAKTLVISSVNMETVELKIGQAGDYNLTLKPVETNMEEVVVVGYNTIAKRSLTGSVSKVKGEELANKPVYSFDQALTGKAAGVLVNTSSGLVGDDVIIRIRGAASISSGSTPLIVMDGVPLNQGYSNIINDKINPLAELNPNDIENIEVLKDASATAIYGSRGSAGVLLITTKKGKAGHNALTYDAYAGFNEEANRMKVLNAEDYNKTINTLKWNAGQLRTDTSAKYNDLDNDGKIDIVNTDWQNELFHKGLVQNHNLAVSGGNQSTTYFASFNYNDNQSYIETIYQKRGSARLNLTTKLNDWLQVGVNTQYSRTLSNNLGSGTGTFFAGIPFGLLTAFPNIPVYGPDGKYYTGVGGNSGIVGYSIPNIEATTHLNYQKRDARRFIGSAFGEVQFIKGLKFKSQVNVDYSTGTIDNFWNRDIGDGVTTKGLRQTAENERNIWSWFNTLNYVKQIGADHELNLLAGSEYTRRTSSYMYTYGQGLNDPDLILINASNYAITGSDNGIDGIDDGLASYFGTVNYGFRKKYLATFNFRTDADSRFGNKNRWGYFPSGSIAWQIAQEDFMRPYTFVNELKLRSSYGVTGNSDIGYFPATSTFAPGSYADIPVLTVNNFGNKDLRWERHLQFDIGIDAVLWNRVNFSLDYYNRKTIDLILNNQVLATVGAPNNIITENVGKLRSRGVELTVGAQVVRKKNFTWTVNFNGAWNNTKVLATNFLGDDLYDSKDVNSQYSIARPGQPLGLFYLIRWAGVNPANGLATFLDVNGNQKQVERVGNGYVWTNVSDGSVTTAIAATDRVAQDKSPYPKYYGGFMQTFNYSSFDASIDLQYAFGFYIYNQTKAMLMDNGRSRNKSEDILDAWTKAGDNTDVPRLFWGESYWSTTGSTRWLEKGDFVRIRNVQIGYSLPKIAVGRIKASRLRLYVQASNLYTFTGYSGIDPEANSIGNTNIGLGLDKQRPYLTRTFTAGINFGL